MGQAPKVVSKLRSPWPGCAKSGHLTQRFPNGSSAERGDDFACSHVVDALQHRVSLIMGQIILPVSAVTAVPSPESSCDRL